jgi:pimeloyl-ACP methyl ester carboxylesterase
VVSANGIELACEVTGDLSRPVVVGVMGTMEGHDLWPDALCRGLVDAGYAFLAFDCRDIGESTHHAESGHPDLAQIGAAIARGERPPVAYDLADLADDVAGLLDALRIERAHLLGYSLGGLVSLLAAVRHPQRVASLVSLMSTSSEPGLSEADPEAFATLLSIGAAGIDLSTARERVESLAGQIAGPRYPTTAAERREFAAAVCRRRFEPASVARQAAALIATPPFHESLRGIQVPTTAVHGTDDVFFGTDHAESIAAHVPKARIAWIEGAGHDLPASLAPEILERVLDHLQWANPCGSRP